MLVAKSEDAIGEKRPQALEFNRVGLQKYITQKYAAAKDDFYQASLLCPRELAFNLNLLQGLVDADLIFYKKVNTLEFLTELQNRELNEGNRKRLEEIVSLTIKKKDVYSIVNTSKGETNDNKSAD